MSHARRASKQRGLALLLAVVFTAVLLVMSIAIVELAAVSQQGAIAQGARARAACLAEAGADEALRTIAQGAPAGASRSFEGGHYVVSVAERADGSGVYDVHAVGASGRESAVLDVAAVPSGASVVVLSWTRKQ